MASSASTIYPQADSGRNIHPQRWFDVTPDPGKTYPSWEAYLSIPHHVAKGLQSQAQELALEKGLHTRAFKNDDEPACFVHFCPVGEELARVRADVCCPGIPREGFMIIIARMARRASSQDKPPLRKSTGPGVATRGSTRGQPKKRKWTSMPADDDSSSESNDDGWSEWNPPQTVPANSERLTCETTQYPTLGPGEKQTSLPKAQSMRIALSPKINPDLICIRITDPKNFGEMQVMCLSDLAEHDIDIHTCVGVDLRRLWRLIHINEHVSEWAFFDERKDYLFCEINGAGCNVHYPALLVYACRKQIAAALERDPGRIPEIEFERRIKPEDRLRPLWPREPSIPSRGPSGTLAANPSPRSGTPAPPATMRPPQTCPGPRQADSGTVPCARNDSNYRTWPEENSIHCASPAKPVARADENRLPRLPWGNQDANAADATSAKARRFPE